MLTDYANVLVDNEYKTNMLALLSEAEKLNTSEEMKEMISKLDDVLEIINHFGSIEEVMVDGVYANYSSRNEGEYDLERVKLLESLLLHSVEATMKTSILRSKM